MPILGVIDSGKSGHLVVPNSYASIGTVTVGSGGASTITFSSIPSTYTHLQIRISAQTNRATYGTDSIAMRFNSDTTSSYDTHELIGANGSANAYSTTSTNTPYWDAMGTSTSGAFGAGIFDILDYANTNKYKTSRLFLGSDNNGSISSNTGAITLGSGLWQSTNAITSINFLPIYGSLFNQYSTFALYGIR